jgi:hypothetical protein
VPQSRYMRTMGPQLATEPPVLPAHLSELARSNRPGPESGKRFGCSFLATETNATLAFNTPQQATLIRGVPSPIPLGRFHYITLFPFLQEARNSSGPEPGDQHRVFPVEVSPSMPAVGPCDCLMRRAGLK